MIEIIKNGKFKDYIDDDFLKLAQETGKSRTELIAKEKSLRQNWVNGIRGWTLEFSPEDRVTYSTIMTNYLDSKPSILNNNEEKIDG